jgi:hypothetical protein
MLASPDPATSQSLGGSPGRLFSQAMTLATGGPHGLAAAAAGLARATDTNPNGIATTKQTTANKPMRLRRPETLDDIPSLPTKVEESEGQTLIPARLRSR